MSDRKTRKGRIATKQIDAIKEVECKHWATRYDAQGKPIRESLSCSDKRDRITAIITELKALDLESPVLDHAILKWEDKLNRLEADE